MVDNQDSKVALRSKLAALADNVQAYSQAIRERGFSCTLVGEDWISRHCSKSDIDTHRRYVAEYARAALCEDSTSNIIFDDTWETRSEWINQLKKERYENYGSVHSLFKDSKTRHLAELSPCLRELSRIAECRSNADVQVEKQLQADFVSRRRNELLSHARQIERCVSALGRRTDKHSLQSFYAEQVFESVEKYGARLHDVPQMHGRRQAVVLEVGSRVLFLIVPSVSSRGVEKGGSAGMGFRLADIDILDAASYSSSMQVVAHLSALLPGGYFDYGRFDSREEFCLVLLAWKAAIEIVLRDVLPVLSGPVPSNGPTRDF